MRVIAMETQIRLLVLQLLIHRNSNNELYTVVV